MKPYFDHEKLLAYQTSVEFVGWVENNVLANIPKGLSGWDQLDRASTSISLNIAEGNGKYTSPDRCRFFDNARGSALECAACLDVLVAKGKLNAEAIVHGKELLQRTVSLLVGLIKSNSETRLYEETAGYRTGKED